MWKPTICDKFQFQQVVHTLFLVEVFVLISLFFSYLWQFSVSIYDFVSLFMEHAGIFHWIRVFPLMYLLQLSHTLFFHALPLPLPLLQLLEFTDATYIFFFLPFLFSLWFQNIRFYQHVTFLMIPSYYYSLRSLLFFSSSPLPWYAYYEIPFVLG